MAADHEHSTSDRWEAVRLEWACLHVPVGTLLFGALLGTSVFSAVSSMWAW